MWCHQLLQTSVMIQEGQIEKDNIWTIMIWTLMWCSNESIVSYVHSPIYQVKFMNILANTRGKGMKMRLSSKRPSKTMKLKINQRLQSLWNQKNSISNTTPINMFLITKQTIRLLYKINQFIEINVLVLKDYNLSKELVNRLQKKLIYKRLT